MNFLNSPRVSDSGVAFQSPVRNTGFLEERLSGRIRLQYATTYLFFEKDGITQQILHELKYRGNLELGMKFGRMFGKELKRGRFNSVDALVPVPLHPNKLKVRGYNQSEVICRGMAEVMKIPVMNNLMERVVENSTQTKKGAEERWENVQGIFQLKNEESIHLSVVVCWSVPPPKACIIFPASCQ